MKTNMKDFKNISFSEVSEILNKFLENKSNNAINILKTISSSLIEEEEKLMQVISLFYVDLLLENNTSQNSAICDVLRQNGFLPAIKDKLNLNNNCDYYIFGSLYRFGIKDLQIKFNLVKAIQFFELGALENNIQCIRALGIMYQTGEDGLIPINFSKAEYWYKIGMQCNDAVSINNLGLIYLENLSYENIARAKNLFQKAIQLGLFQAKVNLMALEDELSTNDIS